MHTAAAVWTGGGFLLWYAMPWLWDRLWIGGIVIAGVYALLGAAIVLACLWGGVRRGWTRARLSAAALLILGAIIVGETGPRITAAASARSFEYRFLQMAPTYQRVAGELSREPRVPRRGNRNGVDFVVDSGPPRRIAFPQPGGVTDNWVGVVYDPSSALRAASRQGGRPVPPELERLFGGRLTGCTPIRGHFYRCSFT